jgi:hypothetical protein
MDRFINFVLILLVFIAFFFGFRVGKAVQKIDTPIKQEVKTKETLITPVFTLKQDTIDACNFSFSYPSTLEVNITSGSAMLKSVDKSLDISCASSGASLKSKELYRNIRNGQQVTIDGNQDLLIQLQDSFDPDFTKIE